MKLVNRVMEITNRKKTLIHVTRGSWLLVTLEKKPSR